MENRLPENPFSEKIAKICELNKKFNLTHKILEAMEEENCGQLPVVRVICFGKQKKSRL